MKRLTAVLLLAASTALADVPVARVADDGRAIDRVAEMTHDRLPVDVLQRIIETDIDLLRGRHADGTYEFARYDRLEAGRESNSFSIQPTDSDHLVKVEMRSSFVYRVVLDIPARRLVVAKNRPLWIDRVEVEYVPQSGGAPRTQTVQIGALLEPGATKTIDVEQISRGATVRIYARADKASGYGNLAVTLIQAKLFDNPDSPYAAAVSTAKEIQKSIERQDIPTIRSMARRMVAQLESAPAQPRETQTAVAAPELVRQLESVEDLLTGTDAERREAADRLHQLIRTLRSSAPPPANK